jgi:hypothetical protein
MLVTHDRDLTQQAGRVITLKAGRIVGDGSLSANVKSATIESGHV